MNSRDEHARRACGRKNRLALSQARRPAQRGAGSSIWVKRRMLWHWNRAPSERPDYAPIASSLAVRVGDTVLITGGSRLGGLCEIGATVQTAHAHSRSPTGLTYSILPPSVNLATGFNRAC